MSHKDLIKTFAKGAVRCFFCDAPLPEHKTWPGKRTHTCQELACVEDLDSFSLRLAKVAPGTVLVRHGEGLCHGPKCGRPLPTGIYASRSKTHCCSAECWYRKDVNPTSMYVCICGCGKKFAGNRSLSRRKGVAFFNYSHREKFLLERNLSRCGALASVALDYLTTFVREPLKNAPILMPFA